MAIALKKVTREDLETFIIRHKLWQNGILRDRVGYIGIVCNCSGFGWDWSGMDELLPKFLSAAQAVGFFYV